MTRLSATLAALAVSLSATWPLDARADAVHVQVRVLDVEHIDCPYHPGVRAATCVREVTRESETVIGCHVDVSRWYDVVSPACRAALDWHVHLHCVGVPDHAEMLEAVRDACPADVTQ